MGLLGLTETVTVSVFAPTPPIRQTDGRIDRHAFARNDSKRRRVSPLEWSDRKLYFS